MAEPNTESVFIKPGPNKRVCAYTIDGIVVCLFNWLILSLLGVSYTWILPPVYFLLRDAFTGQSIGKMIVGLQVVDDQNQKIKPIHGMLRNISLASCGVLPLINRKLFIVSIVILIVEYYSMLSNAGGQRLGDKIGQTRVKDLRPQISDNVFLVITIVCVAALFIYFGHKSLGGVK